MASAPPLEELVHGAAGDILVRIPAGELEAIAVFPGDSGRSRAEAAAGLEAGGGVLEPAGAARRAAATAVCAACRACRACRHAGHVSMRAGRAIRRSTIRCAVSILSRSGDEVGAATSPRRRSVRAGTGAARSFAGAECLGLRGYAGRGEIGRRGRGVDGVRRADTGRRGLDVSGGRRGCWGVWRRGWHSWNRGYES